MRNAELFLIRASWLPMAMACVLGAAVVGCNRGTPPAAPTANQPMKADVPAPSDPNAPPDKLANNDPTPDAATPPDKKQESTDPKAAVENDPSSNEADAPNADETAAEATAEKETNERFVLLSPGGPLVIELRMTIDGKPFRAVREELVDEVLKLADRNGDGRPTWGEVFSDPKRLFGKRLDLPIDMKNRKEFFKTHDTNQNGTVDRDEARRFVARAKSAGSAFALTSSSEYRGSNRRSSIVRATLDADDNGRLSADELSLAEPRLLGRDANDDGTVTWAEMDDTLAGDAQAMMSRTTYLRPPAAMMLGPQADWDGVVYTFAELYLIDGQPAEEAFALVPSLPKALDEDDDGLLSYDEVQRLNTVAPHLVLAANFGRSGDLVAGVSLIALSPELGPDDRVVSHTPRGLLLDLGGYRLQIVSDDRAPQPADEPSAQMLLTMYDADKNGYLDKAEVAAAGPVAADFDDLDTNDDGKVYLDEIESLLRGRRSPQLSAIQAVVRDDQDVLFPLLDANHDGRLTTRELRRCREQLASLDRDGDGQLAADELPETMTIVLGRGLSTGAMPTAMTMAAAYTPPTEGPTWFAHMDSNHDQEISPEEFPGNRDKFRSIDVDADGFISASEAQAAASAQGQ